MRVLVVGSGGREHAIAWKLAQSPKLTELIIAPGNGGTSDVGENVTIDAEDLDSLVSLARERDVDFTIVGPEAPLAAGIVDLFDEAGLLVFGPTKGAARIETSKAFAKYLMLRNDVPTGAARRFDDYEEALTYLNGHSVPVVVKADGLAAGKGVVVAESRDEAESALHGQMVEGEFGEAGHTVLIEEFMEGPELSAFAFVDGERVSRLVAACDYKRIDEGDAGPNTGGIGAYSPPTPDLWNDEVEHEVRTRIIEPVVRALKEAGSPYKGVLYAGLMKTADGLKVIEFNCRMGDPETEVILPRLKSDLLEVMLATAMGDISDVSLDWDPRPAVGVVMASGGYPRSYTTGYSIEGIDRVGPETVVFHAGTTSDGYVLTTDGGRVLTVASLADDLDAARHAAYESAEKITFQDKYFRRDIAAVSTTASA